MREKAGDAGVRLLGCARLKARSTRNSDRPIVTRITQSKKSSEQRLVTRNTRKLVHSYVKVLLYIDTSIDVDIY